MLVFKIVSILSFIFTPIFFICGFFFWSTEFKTEEKTYAYMKRLHWFYYIAVLAWIISWVSGIIALVWFSFSLLPIFLYLIFLPISLITFLVLVLKEQKVISPKRFRPDLYTYLICFTSLYITCGTMMLTAWPPAFIKHPVKESEVVLPNN